MPATILDVRREALWGIRRLCTLCLSAGGNAQRLFYILAYPCPHATAARGRIRTQLYAAAAHVHIQPTRATPRCRTFRSRPKVLSHPKTSSTHRSSRSVGRSSAVPSGSRC